ncbi:caspase family protein [Glacieibacterium frigidum]|uniref:Peptidase C14 caspase domain-containing protein n=1 Tax=Glacieibacterium frigidum TaxID=2593303 RepID=A0A552UAK7_9SPHN|nr:caspase family protein [Glacieibacterium frigidum]TRW15248.1 hypothetical protein FMM06_16615 [Glacieibacterium frigidum]
MKLVLALALLLAAPAQGAVRGVFVGINAYANTGPDLKPLQGSVNDVVLIKATLEERYKLGLDTPGAGCRSENAVSITLTDACATRAAILDALVKRIAASAAGDTLLFFYSGHGAKANDGMQEQAYGYHGTIVPYDGRGSGIVDIFDSELKDLIDIAEDRGVNFVTMFDSCSSGTATRDLRPANARRAGPATMPRPATRIRIAPPAAPSAGPVAAYRVHLAASRDLEVASETPDADGKWNGNFTRALVDAIPGPGRPARTYGDIIAEVRRKMFGTTQNPQAEGALTTPFLGLPPPPRRVFDAEPLGTAVVISGGTLAGVTRGSTYGLYASDAATQAGGPPLATGRVESVEPSRAILAVAPPPGARRALELVHAYGDDAVRLRIDGDGSLAARLKDLDLIVVTDRDPRYVLGVKADVAELKAIDGTPVGSAIPRADPNFDARLRELLRKVANADALLALHNDRGAALADVTLLRACADTANCPDLPKEGDEPLIPAGTPVYVEIINKSDKPLYPYAFYVDGDKGILTLMPPAGARDPALKPGGIRAVPRLRTAGVGRDNIIVIMADEPVDLASLEQAAVRDVATPPRNDLERLLRAARRGASSRDIARVGTWGATVLTVRRVAKETR